MTQEKSEIYLKAFVELNEIINHLNTNLKNKIPKKTLEAIKNSGDKNYQFKYDNTQSLSKQKLLPETISLLSIIYSDYLCSEEEKKKWDEYDKFTLQKQEELKQEKYNANNLFKEQKNNTSVVVLDEKKQLQVDGSKKQSFWSKLKKFIMKIFKKFKIG